MKYLTIGPVARFLGLSCETLRNLERRGIIKPDRDYSGRRIFTENDLKEIEEKLFPKRNRRDGAR